jgi:hypothetical protein
MSDALLAVMNIQLTLPLLIMEHLLEIDDDGIITNQPDRLLELLYR